MKNRKPIPVTSAKIIGPFGGLSITGADRLGFYGS